MVEDMELLAPALEVKADIGRQMWVRGDRALLTQVWQTALTLTLLSEV